MIFKICLISTTKKCFIYYKKKFKKKKENKKGRGEKEQKAVMNQAKANK